VTDVRTLHQINQRLSLRKPQSESLRLLAEVVDLIDPSKGTDLDQALAAIRDLFPSVEAFERDFPSLCFALATGVGKTRLMGAFISYLYLTGKSRNFFILAPNLTIYDKLIGDFREDSPKYVFKGIERFVHLKPQIITAENYEQGVGVRGGDLLGEGAAYINIFNISKINSEVRGGRSPRIKRLQEYIGESYFSYLAGLDDLVLLMDEAHRYRASAGENAISELKPILGLEVTATPKTIGNRSAPFKNVIYRYDLPEAMEDGYVKEPAVGTRADFDARNVSESDLQRIKLEDGIHYHEHVKVQLQTYARQNGVTLVHPFMLVVAQDTNHAREIREFVESDGFFGGRYRGKVAEIHSKTQGEETDENAQRLLNVERDGHTEIVIHVNKLKEGWDVTNLYTIVPLRASASEILTEQTLGRGLRLPYGKRTGVDAVDTLTVIAHDKFNEIIEKAKDADGLIHKKVFIGEGGDVSAARPTMIEAPSVVQWMVEQASKPTGEIADGVEATPPELDRPKFTFSKPEEVGLAVAVMDDVLPSMGRRVRNLGELKSEKVVEQIVADALAAQRSKEGLFPSDIAKDQATKVVREVLETFAAKTIAIPQLVITPTEQVGFWFEPFKLVGLDSWNYQPQTSQLVVQEIRTGDRSVITQSDTGLREDKLEDYVVSNLIDFDEVDYEGHAELLYDLAGQVVARLRAYLPDDDTVHRTLSGHGKQIAAQVFAQLKEHMRRTETGYVVRLESSFTELRPQGHPGAGADMLRHYSQKPVPLSDIKRLVFHGFKRGCYFTAKFDSDTERQLSVLLESATETTIEKWMRPSPGQFRIHDRDGHTYHPDFVVETTTEKLILETKASNEMKDADVVRKARAATLWCHIATEHYAKPNGDKPWRYALIPHDAVQPNATLAGLLAAYTWAPDLDLTSRYELAGA